MAKGGLLPGGVERRPEPRDLAERRREVLDRRLDEREGLVLVRDPPSRSSRPGQSTILRVAAVATAPRRFDATRTSRDRLFADEVNILRRATEPDGRVTSPKMT